MKQFHPHRPVTDLKFQELAQHYRSEQDRWAAVLAPKPIKPTPMFKLPEFKPKKSLFKRIFG